MIRKVLPDKKINLKTSMMQKRNLFKDAIVKIEEKYKADISFIRENTEKVVKERGKLAHWKLASNPENINLFIETKNLVFVGEKEIEGSNSIPE